MAKHVIVIASGETERRSLPHLLNHLMAEAIIVDDVRIPPRNRPLTLEMVEKLVKAAWYEHVEMQPDKFVILIDTDGHVPDDILQPFRDRVAHCFPPNLPVPQVAYAQWHLEAWYFADSAKLREYLGKALGNIDPSNPDEITNPKRHLKNLLASRVYTSLVSEQIASNLQPETIAARSPSFRGFLSAIRNGSTIQPINI